MPRTRSSKRVGRDFFGSHPRRWQLALLESELDAVLRFRQRHEANARDAAKRHQIAQLRNRRRAGADVSEESAAPEPAEEDALCPGPRSAGAPPLPVSPEEMCPVCLDPLAADGETAPLTSVRRAKSFLW